MAKRRVVPLAIPVFEVKAEASGQLAEWLNPLLEKWEGEGWRFLHLEQVTVPKMIKSSMLSTDQGTAFATLAVLEKD